MPGGRHNLKNASRITAKFETKILHSTIAFWAQDTFGLAGSWMVGCCLPEAGWPEAGWRDAGWRDAGGTHSYCLWQGAIFFQAGVDSSDLDCFKKVKQVRQTENISVSLVCI